jgi:chromosome segregation ATPase
MFVDLPLKLIVFTALAFVLGCIITAISSRTSGGKRVASNKPQDHRIRSLEADQRVAQTESEKAKEAREELEDELKQTTVSLEKRDVVIAHQQQQIDKYKRDLKVSVRKTRELRSELTDRASENIKSEVKLREVETELEVAQVSADMIATGVLDYSTASEIVDDETDSDVVSSDDSVIGKSIKDF